MMRMSVEGAKAATRNSDKAKTNAICRSEILLKHLENNLVPISIPVKKEIKRRGVVIENKHISIM